jgi:ADP-ribosylglycohydrolase
VLVPDLDLARLSLDGLSVGDAFGELFFGEFGLSFSRHSSHRTPLPDLPPPPWPWTDDTHMALSIVEVLRESGCIDQDALAHAFARRYREDPYRGYAGGAVRLLNGLTNGADWRSLAPSLFNGGSYGNGGAMRAAPIGGFFAGDPERAAAEARRSAAVTHAHPEGQAGAMAVAVAAAIAATEGRAGGVDFLKAVGEFVPSGPTREGLERAMTLPADDLSEAIAQLGTGLRVSAQDTVPFCLWSAAHHLEDYEPALWWTARGGGDVDTTCAIVGGIVALSAGNIPPQWLACREALPLE